MIYRKFQDKELSLLGFGAMRLPLLEDKSIDQEQVNEMMDYALAHGVNYIDTAFPYHESMSEISVGKALAKHPRESYYLATKYPGHNVADSYDPAPVFETQLKKCGVEYFDFYLLHNVFEYSISTYEDPKWGIIDYFLEEKKKGRIKHLGFSTHGDIPVIKEFLDRHADEMEFCQIQLNYLDWTLQDAKGKYELISSYGIPVWVMEPVRGGKLSNLPDGERAKLPMSREECSDTAYALRWLTGLEHVGMILSGMSNMEQMVENCATFEKENPLSADEEKALMDIAEGLKDSVPCTACRYCCDGCPMELDIPGLISKYNQVRASDAITVLIQMDTMPKDKQPSACIGCGKCSQVCPQKIDIPQEMKNMTEMLEKFPGWEKLSAQRVAEMDAQVEEMK